jgi:diadenosine tetraphosphate (Ap4A) HIT family hydrolase
MKQGFRIEGFDSVSVLDALMRNSRFSSRLLWQNKDYYLIPSISPLVEGHLLLLPKEYYHSCAASYSENGDSFEQAFITAYLYLSRTYCPPILFEHGAAVASSGGASVEYAHLHLVPVQYSYQESIFSIILGDLPVRFNNGIQETLGLLPQEEAYILCGNVKRVLSCSVERIPSQYMRRVVAEVLGLDSWDWREMVNWNQFNRTIERFRSTASIRGKEKTLRCSC